MQHTIHTTSPFATLSSERGILSNMVRYIIIILYACTVSRELYEFSDFFRVFFFFFPARARARYYIVTKAYNTYVYIITVVMRFACESLEHNALLRTFRMIFYSHIRYTSDTIIYTHTTILPHCAITYVHTFVFKSDLISVNRVYDTNYCYGYLLLFTTFFFFFFYGAYFPCG